MFISMKFLFAFLSIATCAVCCSILGIFLKEKGIDSTIDAAALLRREALDHQRHEILQFFTAPANTVLALQSASKITGTFNASNVSTFHEWLCLQMKKLNDDGIYIGTETGSFAIAAYPQDANGEPVTVRDQCIVRMMNAYDGGKQIAVLYNFSATGAPYLTTPPWLRGVFTTSYDPRIRPWYVSAKNQTSWSKVYLNWGSQDETLLTIATPAFDPSTDEKVGVFGADVRTTRLLRYLNSTKIGRSSRMVLVEEDTQIVIGTSWGDSGVYRDPAPPKYNCGEFRNETCDPLTRLAKLDDLTSDRLVNQVLDDVGVAFLYNCGETCSKTIGKDRHRIYVDVVAVKDGNGLKTRLIVMMPESDFLDGVWSASDSATLIACIVGAVIILVFVVGIHVSTQPLKDIQNSIRGASTLSLTQNCSASSFYDEIASVQAAHEVLMSELRALKAYVPHVLFQQDDNCVLNPLAELPTRGQKEDTAEAATITVVDNAKTHVDDHASIHMLRAKQPTNQFSTLTGSMMVVHLTSRAATGNLDAFSAETAAFMDATIPHILHARGVIELQRPSQLVVTFAGCNHIERSALCALRIVDEASQVDLQVVSALHSGTFVTGACGSQGRNAFVVASDFMERGVKLAELSQRCLRCPVIGTDAVAKQLPPSLVSVPVDHVTGLQTSEEGGSVIFEITKATGSETEAAACELTKEVFTLMLNGEYGNAIEKSTNANGSHHVARLGDLATEIQSDGVANYVRSYKGWEITTADIDHNKSVSHTATTMNGMSNSSSDEELQSHPKMVVTGAGASVGGAAVDDQGQLFNVMEAPTQHSSVSTIPSMGYSIDLDMLSTNSVQISKIFEGLTPAQNKQYAQQAQQQVDTAPTRFTDAKKTPWFRSPKSDKLGGGPLSAVYQGMNAKGDVVALKCMKFDPERFIDQKKAVERDVGRLMRLDHPNLSGFISVAVQQNTIIFVIEYLSGGTLRNVVATYKQLLPRAAARRFAGEIVSGLVHLHDQDVVHGDLKPENVMLGADSVCKLTDYGSVLERRITGFSGTMEELESMDLHGTVPYMAPEVARGGLPTTASDIWSFGVLLHELITGELPWEHENGPAGAARDQRKMIRGLACDAGDPGALRPKLSAVAGDEGIETREAFTLVSACLKEDPGLRPSAKDLGDFGFLV